MPDLGCRRWYAFPRRMPTLRPWCWTVARRAKDGFGRMVAAGITAWITMQAIVNIGGVLGVLPITGITLPFVSYGGTAVAVSMAAAGVLVNIAHSGGRTR